MTSPRPPPKRDPALLYETNSPTRASGIRIMSLWKWNVSPPCPMMRWPLDGYSIRVRPSERTPGGRSSWRVSIARTVSGFRMVAPSSVPSREEGEHETRHIRGCGRERAGGSGWNKLEVLRPLGRGHVSPRHGRFQLGRQRLHEGRTLHAQRLQDMGRDVSFERLVRDALHDVTGQRESVIGIGGDGARAENLLRLGGNQIVPERPHFFRARHEQILQHLLEPRRMGEKPPQCDRLHECLRNGEIGVSFTSRSRSSFPCSTNCMTAVAVKTFEMEPGRNNV